VGMGVSMSRESNESGGSSLLDSEFQSEAFERSQALERFAAGESFGGTEALALAGQEGPAQ